MLKTFLNNQKILGILPLINENTFIVELKENVEILNNFFQETVINSDIPATFTKNKGVTFNKSLHI